MFRATLKSLLSRKLRLTLSGLAVVLGVMFVSGSFVLTETLKGSFDSLFTNAYANIDVEVNAKPKTAAEVSEQTTPAMTSEVLEQIRSVPGATNVKGSVNVDGARLIGSNGKVVTTMGAPRFGANWQGEDSFVQLREGRGPSADNEIAINVGLAKAADVHVGDQVGVLTLQPKRMFTIVGLIGYAGGKDSMSSAHEIDFTTPVAQELMLGQRGLYSGVTLNHTKGVSDAQLRDAVQTVVGPDYTVETHAQLEQHATDQYSSGLGFFNKILLGFAAVALFVGTFLIINTFSIIIAQRTRELALMRAIGASRRQIIGSVLVEATAIGVIASAIGLLAGIGVGALLGWIFGWLTEISTAGTRIPVAAVISAFAVGVPITLIAAVLPAFRASKIAPVAAMRESAATDRPMTKITISGTVVTAAGAGLLAVGLNRNGGSLSLVGAGVLTTFLGVSLLTPVFARPVADAIGWLFSWSVPGTLGRLNSRRNPRRTAITAAALMIGVALITGMSVIISSVDATMHQAAENDLHVDLFINSDSNGGPPITFDQSVLRKTQDIHGVKQVVGEYDDLAKVSSPKMGQSSEYISAVSDVAAITRMWAMKPLEGSIGSLTKDQIIVNEAKAKELHLTVGDTVTMQFSKGTPHTITIVGIYQNSALFNGWIGGQDLTTDFRSTQPNWGFIELDKGAPLTTVRHEISTLLADSPEVNVTSMDGMLDRATSNLKQVLTMVQILLGLAILIAVLGIINTLALSIIERTRELGMLRAIGLRRAQMIRMITVESVIISVFGALLGLGVGSGLGIAIVRALKGQGITSLALPWGQLAMYLALAGVIGVIAAVIPAIRAAKVNVLAAIAHE